MSDPLESAAAEMGLNRPINYTSVGTSSGMSLAQVAAIKSGRTGHLLRTVELSSKFDELRKKQLVEQEGRQALDRLSRLDPSLPGYKNARLDILEQTPNALHDAKVADFLRLQDDVFNEAEQDRDFQRRLQLAEEDRKRSLEDRRMEEDRMDRRADERDLETRTKGLSDFGLAKFDDYSKTMPPDRAIREAELDEEDENLKLGLLSSGISELEINGYETSDGKKIPGMLNARGRIDKRKVAELQGKLALSEKQQTAQKEGVEKMRRDLKMLEDGLKSPTLDKPTESVLLQEIETLRKKLLGDAGEVSTETAGKNEARPSSPTPRLSDELFDP